MPVNKFGHTDVDYSQRVVSGGVTLSQTNNTFLRLDGANTAIGDINLGSHKLMNVLDPTGAQDAATKNYVDANKVSRSGDTMTGDLALNVGVDELRTLGCSDLNQSKGFAILLGSLMNQIQSQLNTPITLQTTDGFLCRHAGHDVIRFGLSSNDSRTQVYQDIMMKQHYIGDLHEPSSARDAATKNYVDTTSNSCTALIPTMTSYNTNTNVTQGYLITKSQDVAGQFAWKACANLPLGIPSNGWCTTVNFNNSWIACTFPSGVIATKCLVVGRAVIPKNNFTSWVLEATNDAVTNDATAAAASYTSLYTSNDQSLVGINNYVAYTVNFVNSTPYTTYRFRSTAGVENPGLACFQLYSSVNASNNRIINVRDPISSQDAATKHYIDSCKRSCDIYRGVIRDNTGIIKLASLRPSISSENSNILSISPGFYMITIDGSFSKDSTFELYLKDTNNTKLKRQVISQIETQETYNIVVFSWIIMSDTDLQISFGARKINDVELTGNLTIVIDKL